MAYIDLTLAKQHLRVDESFNGDDEYIIMLIDAAEDAVSRDICENLEDLASDTGELPASLVYAILLKLADFYNNRETVVVGVPTNEIKSLKSISSLFRNYNK